MNKFITNIYCNVYIYYKLNYWLSQFVNKKRKIKIVIKELVWCAANSLFSIITRLCKIKTSGALSLDWQQKCVSVGRFVLKHKVGEIQTPVKSLTCMYVVFREDFIKIRTKIQ